MSQSLPNLLGETMEKIRSMVDANTTLGDPITTPDGVTIVPVSRIKLGFAGGGADFAPKSDRNAKENNFGGGSGAGVTITPCGVFDYQRGVGAAPAHRGAGLQRHGARCGNAPRPH